ncbi:levo-lactonase [Pyricularia oryzae]|nr:levo-lactonase [Pyricularia oryzae]KAI7928255.1 levo-lactonase [Pyricularia oryzae]
MDPLPSPKEMQERAAAAEDRSPQKASPPPRQVQEEAPGDLADLDPTNGLLAKLIMYSAPVIVAAAAAVLLGQSGSSVHAQNLPPNSQFINQKEFNALPSVPPVTVFNATGIFIPPGQTAESMQVKPFHVYDEEFINILGINPTLTLLGETESDPVFHEAVVWHPPTDEVFFVQNAGAKAASTGLNKSAIIQKISLSEADLVSNLTNAVGKVKISKVDSNPQVINPNGATNYRGQFVYCGEGQGADITSTLYLMNPKARYNTTVLVNNFFGRQFSSLNDAAVHPQNKDLYFTDVLYGYYQDFRPAPGLRNQVYRYNDVTGALTIVADGFDSPNGITFSPDGRFAYVTDSGINHGFFGYNFSAPSSIYRFDVKEDGTWENRKTFAYINSGVPDGVHCDAQGNVYAGCGDGINVWNPSGKLIGKIHIGGGAANFAFAGKRMVIMGETKLWYATMGAMGATVKTEM